VRLAAAREDGDLAALRKEVDRGLRTRRFLGYRESSEWAHAARPVVEELRSVAVASPSKDLVMLLERAIGHVVKMIMHADDSNGTIGDLARELLDVHAQACDAGVADPVKLAAWMVRFSCLDVIERAGDTASQSPRLSLSLTALHRLLHVLARTAVNEIAKTTFPLVCAQTASPVVGPNYEISFGDRSLDGLVEIPGSFERPQESGTARALSGRPRRGALRHYARLVASGGDTTLSLHHAGAVRTGVIHRTA
jgi:hypothetical protein